MNNIWQVFVNSLKGGADSEISSRRLITMIIMQVSVLINLAIIVLAFVVAFRPADANANTIQILDKLIELTVITYVAIFLLVGLITWQNVNDTLQLVRGGAVPQTVNQTASNIQTEAQTIKDTVAAAAGDLDLNIPAPKLSAGANAPSV
jgi:heme/copper-type cytochrome/quinol oxidase subunit 2